MRELGRKTPAVSWITKIFGRFLVDIEKMKNNAQSYWDEFFDTGKLYFKEKDEDGEMIVEERGFELPSAMLPFLEGYVENIFASLRKNPMCKIDVFKRTGENVFRFNISWKN